MSFTIFSVILLLIVGVTVLTSVIKGLKHGAVRSAMRFATIILSAIGAAIPAILLSSIPARSLADTAFKSIPMIRRYAETLPSIEKITFAVVDALITPFIFVVFFPLVYLVMRVLVNLFCRKCWKISSDDASRVGSYVSPAASDSPSYLKSDAPWHVRHDRLLGGITGGLCGFFLALLLLSPILGTLSTIGDAYRYAQTKNFKWSNIKIKESAVTELEPYINDGVVATLNFAGGGMIYDGLATSSVIRGEHISVRKEMRECMDATGDLFSVLRAVSGNDELTREQRIIIDELGKRVGKSDVARLLTADIVNGACSSWLNGEKFMSISMPSCSASLQPLVNGILQTCAASTPDCVGNDLGTLLKVYCIISDHGLRGNVSADELSRMLDDGNILNTVYAELDKNPCMQYLRTSLTDATLHIMAAGIDASDLTVQQKKQLMQKLSDSLNLVNAMENATFEEKVNAMTEYTVGHAKQSGVNVPEDLAKMATTSMLEQLGDRKSFTAEEMEGFMDYYVENTNR